jgi:hypothetical protein
METQHRYQADLAEKALPEILISVYRHGIPGVLNFTRDRILRRVYVRNGLVVHAASNDLNDSLGGFLLQSGRLTMEQFRTTMESRAAGSSRYGAVLVAKRLMAPIAVQRAIREQVESILWSLFTWETGSVAFEIGEATMEDAIPLALSLRNVVLEGIKRTPNAKTLVTRLGQKDTVFEPHFQTEELIDVGLNEQEYALLMMIDGQRSFLDLCSAGPLPPADNARMIYAFSVLGLVQKQVAAGSGEIARSEKWARGAGTGPFARI